MIFGPSKGDGVLLKFKYYDHRIFEEKKQKIYIPVATNGGNKSILVSAKVMPLQFFTLYPLMPPWRDRGWGYSKLLTGKS